MKLGRRRLAVSPAGEAGLAGESGSSPRSRRSRAGDGHHGECGCVGVGGCVGDGCCFASAPPSLLGPAPSLLLMGMEEAGSSGLSHVVRRALGRRGAFEARAMRVGEVSSSGLPERDADGAVAVLLIGLRVGVDREDGEETCWMWAATAAAATSSACDSIHDAASRLSREITECAQGVAGERRGGGSCGDAVATGRSGTLVDAVATGRWATISGDSCSSGSSGGHGCQPVVDGRWATISGDSCGSGSSGSHGCQPSSCSRRMTALPGLNTTAACAIRLENACSEARRARRLRSLAIVASLHVLARQAILGQQASFGAPHMGRPRLRPS